MSIPTLLRDSVNKSHDVVISLLIVSKQLVGAQQRESRLQHHLCSPLESCACDKLIKLILLHSFGDYDGTCARAGHQLWSSDRVHSRCVALLEDELLPPSLRSSTEGADNSQQIDYILLPTLTPPMSLRRFHTPQSNDGHPKSLQDHNTDRRPYQLIDRSLFTLPLTTCFCTMLSTPTSDHYTSVISTDSQSNSMRSSATRQTATELLSSGAGLIPRGELMLHA